MYSLTWIWLVSLYEIRFYLPASLTVFLSLSLSLYVAIYLNLSLLIIQCQWGHFFWQWEGGLHPLAPDSLLNSKSSVFQMVKTPGVVVVSLSLWSSLSAFSLVWLWGVNTSVSGKNKTTAFFLLEQTNIIMTTITVTHFHPSLDVRNVFLFYLTSFFFVSQGIMWRSSDGGRSNNQRRHLMD